MQKLILSGMLTLFATAGLSQTTPSNSCSTISLGPMGALNGFVPSPNDAWHQDISNTPIDVNSARIITTNGDLANRHLHPDFSSVAGGNYGIPYTVVGSRTTPAVPFTNFNYYDESDVTSYPIPSDLPIEGAPGDCPTDGSDRHAIIIDKDQCVAYEFYQAGRCSTSKPVWSASNGALWDLTITEKRPYGSTSVDAAGLSVFEGLIRYDEIVAGVINHAIRFTANHTKNNANNGYFTAPATHASGTNWGNDNIIGMRIRLRADFDLSGFSVSNQIILKAMKQYGMILADNGSDLFFQGTPDARWDDNDLNALKVIPTSAFEVIKMNPVYDAQNAPSGNAPTINSFSASSSTTASGTGVILSSTTTDASYNYVSSVGFVRGPVTVFPTATTTYVLTSRNAFGTTVASTTVIVSTDDARLQFAPIQTQKYGATPFLVYATSTSPGAITYSVLNGAATISNGVVNLTGIGVVTLQASQISADGTRTLTAQVSFRVDPIAPTLVFAAVPDRVYSTVPFGVSTTSNSSGSNTYSVLSGPASLYGNVVTLSGTGQVVLQVSQAAAGGYTAATASTSFNVSLNTYLLTIASSGSGGTIAVSPASNNGYYPSGAVITVTALPNPGYIFTNWLGNVANSASTTTSVTMNTSTVLSATFAPALASGVLYQSGFTSSGLSINGSARLQGTRLRLTNYGYQASSAFLLLPVNVQSFVNDFTFQITDPAADGMMFVLQNQGSSAVGDYGTGLGFGGMQKSVGIKFDLYNNSGEGVNSTGLYTNGTSPTVPSIDLTPSGLNLHSGNILKAHMTYDGAQLKVSVADTVTGALAEQTYTIDIPAIVGSNTAFVGFTAGTGGASATQDILTWTFSPGASVGTPTPVAVPTFSPVDGAYPSGTMVSLTSPTTGATLHYTLDGTQATESSPLYSGPITLSSTTNVNAIAALNGSRSVVVTANYIIVNSVSRSGYAQGFTSSGLSINGSARLQGTRLRLTNYGYQASSAFLLLPVNVQSFVNDFTFQITDPAADGMMFVLQNQGSSAVGDYGTGLGFGGMQKSVGIKFDLYNNSGEGVNSTGLYTNGTSPTVPSIDLTPSGLNLHSGNILKAHMTYDGAQLKVSVADTVTGALAEQTYTIDIPAIVGSNTAFVGFTAGTGGASATQDILTWTFSPGALSTTQVRRLVVMPRASHFQSRMSQFANLVN